MSKQDEAVERDTLICYACDKQADWLAPDSRCSKCTAWTPAEIRGEEEHDYDN